MNRLAVWLWSKYTAATAPYRQVLKALGALGFLVYWVLAFLLGQGLALPLAAILFTGCLFYVLEEWRGVKGMVDRTALHDAALGQMEDYTAALEAMNGEIHTFRRDYLDTLTAMSAYLEAGDRAGLEGYVHAHVLPLGRRMEANHYKLAQLANLHVTEAKSIIAAKGAAAQERRVDFTAEVTEPVEDLHAQVLPFCRILGALLDNAIEAAADCPSPWVRVALVNKRRELVLVVANSAGEVENLGRLTERGATTKGEGRGLGLYGVRRMVEQSAGLTLDLSAGEGRFTAALYCREGG